MARTPTRQRQGDDGPHLPIVWQAITLWQRPDLPRFERRAWQMEALYQALMQEGRVFGPVSPDLAAGREDQAERRAEVVLDVLRAIHRLEEVHSNVPRLLARAGEEDRIVRTALREKGPATPADELKTLARLIPRWGPDALLHSPLFTDSLARAWGTAAGARPDHEQELPAARELLQAFADALVAPTKGKQLPRAVRVRRAEAAADVLSSRLPATVKRIREAASATLDMNDPDDVLDVLRRARAERETRERADGAAYRTVIVGHRPTCPTCEHDPDVLTARALALYRRARTGKRGPLDLRQVAAAVLLHRCPDPLDRRKVARALASLEKRRTRGTTS